MEGKKIKWGQQRKQGNDVIVTRWGEKDREDLIKNLRRSNIARGSVETIKWATDSNWLDRLPVSSSS